MSTLRIEWKRVRPGLYESFGESVWWAQIERGQETRFWWWAASTRSGGRRYGRADSLREAKLAVGEVAR